MKPKRVIVFGTGTGAERVLRVMPRSYEVIAFADNNTSRHGAIFHGKPVIPPVSIRDRTPDAIVVASSFFDEILEQLVGYGIPEEAIERVSLDVLLGERAIDPVKLRKLAVVLLTLALAAYGAVRLIRDLVLTFA